jgi:hypothetical protein
MLTRSPTGGAINFWLEYSKSPELLPFIDRCKQLYANAPYDPKAAPPSPNAQTKDEEDEFQNLKRNLVVGFCIAGYWLPDRDPFAFEVTFDPLLGQPTPQLIQRQTYKCWGVPNMIQRLIFGFDDGLKNGILNAGMWNGTSQDLDSLLAQQALAHPLLPIRDAIDFVHACAYSTIKAMKFSNLFQICGGPSKLP